MKINAQKLFAYLAVAVTLFTSCDKDEDPMKEQQQLSSELVFTEIRSNDPEFKHGNHFHGLDGATDHEVTVLKFDTHGQPIENGHLHLDPEAVYRINLKTYDTQGKETQDQYIANAETAANYKVFLLGGNFKLNKDVANGAIFQPRETKYADGTAVTGSAGIGTTGIISYLTIGAANEIEKDITFILRKVDKDVKPTIIRDDWNIANYDSKYKGSNVLELKFEIHTANQH